jgi:hypothetical protein
MRRNRGTKDEFCKSLDWEIPIKWFDRTGLHKLDADRTAKIELATRGTQDHYPGFMVVILNKREGEVDRKFFKFDDYLDRDLSARTDGREDYPHSPRNRCYEVTSYCGWEFYIAKPKSTRAFCAAVEAYVESFR